MFRFFLSLLLFLVTLCSCDNTKLRRLPKEKDVVFEGRAQAPQQSAYRPGQARDIQLDLTSSDEEAKEAKFKVLSWAAAHNKQGTLDASSLFLGNNTLHYTPKEPGTHELKIRVAVEGEEALAQTLHYTIEAPVSEWKAAGNTNNMDGITLTISDTPEEWNNDAWHITSTTWSGGLSGQIAPKLALNRGENRIPLTVEMTTLTEPPSLKLLLQGPDNTVREVSIDFRETCIAKLQAINVEDHLQAIRAHNNLVSQQASTYQGNLIGNARVEAKTALEALQAKTISLQTEANTQLGRLASSVTILQSQGNTDLVALNGKMSALQRERGAMDVAMNTLQPMLRCLEDRERGPIDPWGVLYQALQQEHYEEASMASHLDSPLLNVTREGDRGNTLLHLAIKQGNVALSRILINKGATVNVRDLSSKTPLQYATEASNQAAISLLLEAGAQQDLPPNWQLQGNYDTTSQQMLLTISDAPDRLQQARDRRARWHIINATWSGGLSGQIAPNLSLNLGEHRIPLTVEMTTLTELPSLQLVFQGPDRAFRHTAITLTEMCITKLSDVTHQLAGQIEKVDQYIQESNTVIHDENNTDKKARVTTLLERIRAFKEQYEGALQMLSRNIAILETTQFDENVVVLRSHNDRLGETITHLDAVQQELQYIDDTKFDATKWRSYFGEVGPEPPIPTHIEALLSQPCPLFPGKKVYESHLLTLIPATVDGTPLTLSNFQTVLKRTKELGHHKAGYGFYCSNVKQEFGEKIIGTSYWVLMTRDVLPGSRDKTYEEQRRLVVDIAENTSIAYTLPTILEGVVSTLCYHVETGKDLFPYNPPSTISRCEETLARGFTVTFGQLYNSGIRIVNHRRDNFKLCGVAAAVR